MEAQILVVKELLNLVVFATVDNSQESLSIVTVAYANFDQLSPTMSTKFLKLILPLVERLLF